MTENLKYDFSNGKKNSRHHYIPKFLLKGFTNSEGKLFVFDKQKNRILNKPQPPKSIFYEVDRNTIEISDNQFSSIIEDILYSQKDSKSSEFVRYFQNEDIERVNFTEENTSMFFLFLIHLFWRIPKTDVAFKRLWKQSEILSTDIDPKLIRNDPAFKKLHRAGLFKHHVDEMMKSRNNLRKLYNIHQSPVDEYVIGDYPILFRKTPKLFSEFGKSDFIVAISSRRLYSSTIESYRTNTETALVYNAAIINQSTRYVACSDCRQLLKSVEFYNELKRTGLNFTLTAKAFESLK